MVTESSFYEGTVRHVRSSDVDHEFTVSLFMVFINLDKLPALLEKIPGWSTSFPSLAQFRRSDHFGTDNRPLAEVARDEVEKRMDERPTGRVYLLTHFRYLGYLFNPVSFYYCYDTDETLTAVLAEVHNTPWHEEHVYCLPVKENASDGRHTVTLDKEFHVSPFQPMDQYYEISFADPGDSLSLTVSSFRESNRELMAHLDLRRRPFHTKEAYRLLLRYPFMSFKVTATIYYQALRLWWKNASFYSHPESLQS